MNNTQFNNQPPTNRLKNKYSETWRFRDWKPSSVFIEDVGQPSESKEHKVTNGIPRQD